MPFYRVRKGQIKVETGICYQDPCVKDLFGWFLEINIITKAGTMY